MGKRIIAQRRGKGSTTYRCPSFNFKGAAKHPAIAQEPIKGTVIDIIHCPAHSAPLVKVEYENGESSLMIAPENICVNQIIENGSKTLELGNTLALKDIPEGTLIYNIENVPGDGGKFVRSSGTFARIVSQMENQTIVLLPSKKQKSFNLNCRATIGIVAGSGRTEKPFLKAGTMFFKMKAKNHLYPRTASCAMNAVDHPFGNKRSSRKSKARVAPKNAPPGRKVGMIRARRTGRKKK
ncbi:50S ribosomal protein L2 [Candidatus Woesearchaeota archaeon]|nr:50S ribosomal protein L2P [uncultured archaeon]MBS3122737.1 50S ribosomal protein L2 [Candidatus Woesearchaeota archaeon]